ncbi:MAG: hypothetical protein ACJ8AT_15550 [Hyalangium sp.]|uniref:hypothetical protein n=1 Tax=Hyalangium sp. TaxID=2028555 RepID=UPI003899A663
MTREEFLEWAQEEIVAPRASEGREPFGEVHYWAVHVSKGTYFAVDALANGTLRVHLYSSNDAVKQGWSARRPVAQPVPVAHAWTSPGVRDNGPGKRAYIGFEWTASSSDYGREKKIATLTAGWLDQFWSTE